MAQERVQHDYRQQQADAACFGQRIGPAGWLGILLVVGGVAALKLA